MATWTSEELSRIEAADELEIAPRRRDGTLRKPVPIWVVRTGDDLYVRSYKGYDGAWFRAALASHEGRIRAGGVEKDVTFTEEADPDVNERIEAAYRDKYHRYGPTYVDPMVATQARATTLKLLPR
ncbi:DUF2255 family protein [Nonomuraea purpurea]|uniref:DUF2255 family protein n=1 Tax=Nonomuraea purpurea TaxID=1849276 RepID=A0ABV8GJE1_9ACTN